MNITKRQLRRIIKEEKLKLLSEMNPDSTISGDEDAERKALMSNAENEMFDLIQHVRDEAERIGGGFRSPGIRSEVYKMMTNMLRDTR